MMRTRNTHETAMLLAQTFSRVNFRAGEEEDTPWVCPSTEWVQLLRSVMLRIGGVAATE